MSRRTTIDVDGLAHPGQPIPVATRIGGWVFSSPVGPRDPATGEAPEGAEAQVRLTFDNLARILGAADCEPGDVADVSVVLADRSRRDVLNAAWVEFFGAESPPARQVLEGPLPDGIHILLRFVALSP